MKRTIALGMSVALAMGGVATPAIAFAQTDNPIAQQQGEQEKYEHIVVNKNTDESQRKAAIEKLAKALKLEYKGVDLLKNDGYVELPVKKQGGGFVYDGHDINMPRFVLSGLKPNTKVHINFGFAHSDAISFEPNKENLPQCTADYITPSVTIGEFKVPEPYVNVQDGKIYYSNLYFNTNFNGNTHVNNKATKFTIKEKWIIESADVWVKTPSAEHSIDTYSGKGVGKNGVSKTQLFKFLNGTEYDTNNTIRVDSSKRGNTELVYINWSGLKPNSSLNFTINTHHLPTRRKKFEVPRPLEEKPYIFTNEKVSEDGIYKKVFEIERYGNGQNISLKDVACDLSDETIALLKGKDKKHTGGYEKVLITNDGKENNFVEKKLVEHGVKLSISDKTAPCFEGDDCTMQTDELSVTGLKPNSIMSVYIITGDTGQTVQLETDSDGNAKKLFSYKSHDSENQVIWPVVKSFEGFLLKEKSTPQKENTDEYEHLVAQGDIKNIEVLKKLEPHIVSIADDEGTDLTSKKGKISLNEKGEGFVNIKLSGLKPNSEVSGTLGNLAEAPAGFRIKNNEGAFSGTTNSFGELETKTKIIVTSFNSSSPAAKFVDVSKAEITTIDCWAKKNYTKPADNSIIQFKDPVLKKCILAEMEGQNLINSSARDITKADALKLKKLDFTPADGDPSSGVRSLDGIESFKNLTELDLTCNQVSNIKPLAGLINLTNLNMSMNDISDITPLKDLTNLTELNLNTNQIIDITPLNGLTNLTRLDIHSNRISDATPLKGLTKLENIDAMLQMIDLQPTTTKVDLTKEVKGFGNAQFKSDENVENGILTYKAGMKNPYTVQVSDRSGNKMYSATINVVFPKTKETESQTDDVSVELQKYLDGNSQIIATANYKNADDNLKQAYDKAITDGKAIYDKLSSTPEQVKQAAEKIKQALEKLNGDTKFQNSIQRLEQQLKDIKSQIDESQYEHINMFDYPDGSKERKDLFEKLKPYIANTHDENNHKIDLGKPYPLNFVSDDDSIDWYVKFENLRPGSKIRISFNQTSDSAKSYSATNNVSSYTDEKGNGTVRSDGTFSDVYEFINSKKGQKQTFNAYPVVDCWIKTDRVAELKQAKQQLQQTKNALEKLKNDKALSDEQKQAEIDKLNGQIENLGKQVAQLTNDKKTLSEQLQQAQSNLTDVQKKLQTATEQGVADKSKIEQLNGKISTLNGQLEQLKLDSSKSIEQKQQEIAKLNGQIEDLNKQITQLTNDKKTLSEQLQQAQSNLADVQKKLQTATEQGVADKSKIEELNGQISTLNGQIEKLKSDKTLSEQQKQAEIDKLNGQITDLGKQIEQLTKEKQSLQQQLDAATDNIKKLTGELDKAKEQGTADKSTIQSLNEQLQQAKNTLEQLKSDKTKSDDQKQKEIDQLNAKITEFGNQIAQLTKDKENLTQQLQTIQQSLADVQKKLQKAQEQGTMDANNIATLNQQVKALNEQLNQLKQDKTKSNEEKQKEIDKLNGQIEELNKQVAQLTKDKGSLQQQLDTANGKVQTLTDELNKAKQQGTADASTIAALNSKVNELQNKLDKLKEDKTLSEQQKQAEIDKLNSQIADLGKQIEQLTKDKQNLQSQIEQLNKRIEELNTKANTCSTSDGEKAKELEKVKGELQQVKQQLEQLKQDKAKSDEQKQAEIDKLNEKIKELEKQVKDLSTRTRPENGSIILPNGNVINPDGTVVLLDGNKIKPDGTIVDSQGKPVDMAHATVDKDGNKVLPNGIKIKPNGDKELPDGVIVKNNGNVILPDGKVAYFAGGAIVAPLINDKPEFDLEKYKKEHPEEFNNSMPDNNSSNGGSSTGGGLSVTVINGDSGSGSTNTTDKKETPKEDTEKEKKEPVKQTQAVNTGAKVTISFVTKAKDLITTIEKEVDEKLDKKDVSAVKATAIKTKLAELKQRLSSSTEDEAKPLVNELKQIKADLDKQRDSQKIEKTNNLHDKRVLDKDKQGEDKLPKTSDNAPIGAVGVMVGMLGILFGSKYKKAKHAKK